MESHLYRRKLLDGAISKAKWGNTVGLNGLKYIDRIKEICCDSAMVSRDKSRVYRYLQHLVHVIENERERGYGDGTRASKNKFDQIREELMAIDKVCNEPASAQDYYEKCLTELAAYDRLKQSIKEIIGYMNGWVEQKNNIEQIREELMEIDKVCNDLAGAHDYYEKWLHELAAYDRFKQSIREIIE